jgi:DNA-directed RNA polymerase subunit RPC12/RpoP
VCWRFKSAPAYSRTRFLLEVRNSLQTAATDQIYVAARVNSGTAIAVIVVLLILLASPEASSGRAVAYNRCYPVCGKRLVGSLSYRTACGSMICQEFSDADLPQGVRNVILKAVRRSYGQSAETIPTCLRVAPYEAKHAEETAGDQTRIAGPTGMKGRYKYVCEDCGHTVWLSRKDRATKFGQICPACGRRHLVPSHGSHAKETSFLCRERREEQIELWEKKKGM